MELRIRVNDSVKSREENQAQISKKGSDLDCCAGQRDLAREIHYLEVVACVLHNRIPLPPLQDFDDNRRVAAARGVVVAVVVRAVVVVDAVQEGDKKSFTSPLCVSEIHQHRMSLCHP